jgi:hypothetical protein
MDDLVGSLPTVQRDTTGNFNLDGSGISEGASFAVRLTPWSQKRTRNYDQCGHMGATFAWNTDGEIVEQVLVEVHDRHG